MGQCFDHRRHVRIHFVLPVAICWTGPTGEQHHVTGKAHDLCTYGIGVEISEAIPRQTQVSVEVNTFQFNGEAKVTACRARGSNFRVGLQFENALPFFLDAKRADQRVPTTPSRQVQAGKKQAKRSGFSLSQIFSLDRSPSR